MQDSPEKRAGHRLQVIEILADIGKALTMPNGDAPPYSRQSQPSSVTEARYHHHYQQGRINDIDLAAAFRHYTALQPNLLVCETGQRPICRQDIYRLALLFDFPAISDSQLRWFINEQSALSAIQPDVPENTRQQLLSGGANEATTIGPLWVSLCNGLQLPPEIGGDAADGTSIPVAASGDVHASLRQLASDELEKLLTTRLGKELGLRGVVQSLSGVDILEPIQQQLHGICTAFLDVDHGACATAEHKQLGLYGFWRALAHQDTSLFLHQLPDWQTIIAELPEDAVAAIVWQLRRFDIPPTQWAAYLQQLLMESPDWPIFIDSPPHCTDGASASVADFLAIRLTLDRLWLNQICHDLWKIESKVSALNGYFHRNLSEFWVRLHLYQGRLPEYLTRQADALILRSGSERHCRSEWQQLADVIYIRQYHVMAASGHAHNGWRLFRLCQHLGLNAGHLHTTGNLDLSALLSILDNFDWAGRERVWLYAYGHHYRQTVFAAVKNHQKMPTATPGNRQTPIENRVRWQRFSDRFQCNRLLNDQFCSHFILTYLKTYLAAPVMLANILMKTLFSEGYQTSDAPLLPDQGHLAAIVVGCCDAPPDLFDDRVLLVPYDYACDPEGQHLATLLLPLIPKRMHHVLDNPWVTDLAAGLPDTRRGEYSAQPNGCAEMPMHLLVLVEIEATVLDIVLAKNPGLRQRLWGNGCLLAVKPPGNGHIHLVQPLENPL